ncbi:hypothetical protein K435DRAFT_395864 [Dendrothele bispora CBS 962.96]|uniref:Uncharacterized protein n=1 Tax=Dendrothele bispora (strain CBS 962.96) TaxID=1314807 RepID=A0A4S8L9N3_DENBC|nr:hypothetical protein K435DRAFT_395864 [Dendrothele bispora CBS 962.96]
MAFFSHFWTKDSLPLFPLSLLIFSYLKEKAHGHCIFSALFHLITNHPFIPIFYLSSQLQSSFKLPLLFPLSCPVLTLSYCSRLSTFLSLVYILIIIQLSHAHMYVLPLFRFLVNSLFLNLPYLTYHT